jgi:L-ascorbate 6-phosphate lactonase
MIDLAREIKETTVPSGSLAIFWLAQAGFVFKTPKGTVIYVDPYLTDCVERLANFKRIMASLVSPEEVEADAFVSTHSHPDHLDVDALPIVAERARLRFVGAPDCRAAYQDAGIPASRVTILEKGKSVQIGDATLTGVYADHGELAPDALGLLIEVDGIKVWQVGDTAYRPEKWQDIFAGHVDVILPPINGAFGNLDGVEAARLAHDAHAKVAIPCHYWMFAEHNGNPAQFLQGMKEHAPEVQARLMSQGELFIYKA